MKERPSSRDTLRRLRAIRFMCEGVVSSVAAPLALDADLAYADYARRQEFADLLQGEVDRIYDEASLEAAWHLGGAPALRPLVAAFYGCFGLRTVDADPARAAEGSNGLGPNDRFLFAHASDPCPHAERGLDCPLAPWTPIQTSRSRIR